MYTSLKPLPIVFLRGLGAPYDMYSILGPRKPEALQRAVTSSREKMVLNVLVPAFRIV